MNNIENSNSGLGRDELKSKLSEMKALIDSQRALAEQQTQVQNKLLEININKEAFNSKSSAPIADKNRNVGYPTYSLNEGNEINSPKVAGE